MISVRDTKTGFKACFIHYSEDPEKDADWVARIQPTMPGWRWRKEFEGEAEARGGERVYDMFDRAVHVVSISFEQRRTWTLYRSIDHGRTHPCVCIWVGVSPDGDLYAYREYHEADKTIEFNARNIHALSAGESYEMTYGGHDMGKKMDNSEYTIAGEYAKYFISATSVMPNVEIAVDRVSKMLIASIARWSLLYGKVHPYFLEAGKQFEKVIGNLARQRALYVSPQCTNLIRQLENIRWATIHRLVGDELQERPEKVDDDAHDALKNVVFKEPLYIRPHIRISPPDNYKPDVVAVADNDNAWLTGEYGDEEDKD